MKLAKLNAKVVCCFAAILVVDGAASAQDSVESDTAIQDVLACQALVHGVERLSCFDAAIPALSAAFPRSALSAEEIAQAKIRSEIQQKAAAESVFGKTLEDQSKDEVSSAQINENAVATIDELKEIASMVKTVEFTPLKKAIVYLDNGQIWRQLDSDTYKIRAKSSLGKEAIIKKKLMGSHMMSIGGGRLIRVTRIK